MHVNSLETYHYEDAGGYEVAYFHLHYSGWMLPSAIHATQAISSRSPL